MKTRLLYLFLGLGMLFAAGCSKYPPSSDRLLEDLVVTTQYDTKVDFNQYKTFAIAGEIVKITAKDTTKLTNQTAMSILDQVSKNMEARGFVKSVTPAIPDFGIQVIYYENTNIYAYYGGYWGYDYWGWYYPYYPVYYSTYTVGMLNIELVDLKVVDPSKQKLYLRWNAYIRGLMTGSHSTATILSKVDQAFIQTPQLKTTPLQ